MATLLKRLFVLVLLGAATLVTACASDTSATAQLEARAKVTRAAAEKTALATVTGGVIKGGGIEEEDGKLIWSFDIGTPGSTAVKEVNVDALTGTVVAEAPEAKASEASEVSEKGEGAKPGAAEKDEKDEDVAVTFSQLPAAVKTTIKPMASESEVTKISKGDVDGTQAYEFEIDRAGKKSEVAITPDGKILGTEEMVDLADVPATVRKTITEQAATGKLVSVEKVVEGGKTTYEAVIEKQGKQTEIVVGPDGKMGGA